MPDLTESLQGRDLGHLRIIAQLWGIELEAPDVRTALVRLAPAMLDRPTVEQSVADLPDEARDVLDDLASNQGRMPWALFSRRYGALREIGPGKRDREHPYLHPISPTEVLWYRAWIARSFFDTATGPEEFAYIPSDLLILLPPPQEKASSALGRPASAAERTQVMVVNDHILDHACTLLAALRMGIPPPPLLASTSTPFPLSVEPLQLLLSIAGIVDDSGLPMLEPARTFLEASRGVSLAALSRAWLESKTLNELRLIPGLSSEGNWQNDPRRARQAVLGFLATLPAGVWWSLPGFVAAIQNHQPDFQRPAGDYDSWFIRDSQSGEFLRGFENWDQVDGTLIRFLLCGPMHWLGMIDLAAPTEAAPITAFRLSAWAESLLRGEAPPGLPDESGVLKVRSDAGLQVPRLAARTIRYQVARFCDWEKETHDAYLYRLTPASLGRAHHQGLTTSHLLALLHRHADAVPPSLVKALERWEKHGSQARMERLVVLRVSSPEILQALRTSRAARFLGDPLSPTAVAVKPGAWAKVMAVLVELGYFGESRVGDTDL